MKRSDWWRTPSGDLSIRYDNEDVASYPPEGETAVSGFSATGERLLL